MSGTLRTKKPKETPKNLQWNNFQKNLAVAQTSFLQYLGKRESKQVPKEFSIANAKVKKLQENFEELVKASKYYIKASQGIIWASEIQQRRFFFFFFQRSIVIRNSLFYLYY